MFRLPEGQRHFSPGRIPGKTPTFTGFLALFFRDRFPVYLERLRNTLAYGGVNQIRNSIMPRGSSYSILSCGRTDESV